MTYPHVENPSFRLEVHASHLRSFFVYLQVAIKHIKRKLKSWKAIVDLREVQSLRKLSHPNIVKMTEVILERYEH